MITEVPASTARELTQLIEERWRRMRTAVDALDSQSFDLTTSSGWTIKELLAHMAFWDETSVPVVMSMIRGQDTPEDFSFGSGYLPVAGVPWPTSDEHNLREAAWARDKTPEEVLSRWDKAHDWVMWVLATLTDEEADTEVFRYLSELDIHYSDHMPELEALIGSRRFRSMSQ